MAYSISKTGEITFGGFDKGIGTSPHAGIGNIQAGNIATETGEVMCSFARVQQSQTVTNANGTIFPLDSGHLTPQISGGTINLVGGVWINVSASTISGLSTGNYYVLSNASGFTSMQISSTYLGTPITGFGNTGTATFSLIRNMGNPVAGTIEKYSDGTNFQYRYYVLDVNGLLWVNDSGVSTAGVSWFLPDTSISYFGSATPTGLTVLNGWVMVFAGNNIWCKPTVLLGATPGWTVFASGGMLSPATSPNPHFAITSHGRGCYYTDGNFIGSIFPNTSLLTTLAANIQSYASYTAVTTTGTLGTLIAGSTPYTIPATRIPAVFFTGGTQPSNLVAGTIYYIDYSNSGTFSVYSALTGGSAIDIAAGAAGTQYFNTFYPTSSGGKSSIQFTQQRLTLPFFETAQCLVEIGGTVLIGCKGSIMYAWNQIDISSFDLIPLPENNVVNMLTVNNMAYIFAGSKGNIYLSNGSVASAVISVPDYCAGIAGTPASYIEPYFTWGGAMYLRGRVYFSILDQTATKSGNCGGIWSFIPTQNIFIGQDSGIALRMENQSSYGTYNGVSTVLLPSQNQSALGPQYWNAWYSSISSPTYGIDFTSTTPSTPCVIETDLVPTGTMLEKKTFKQIEYKLSTPLVSGESVSIKYRLNATDTYVTCGTAIVESSTELSGYFPSVFEKTQWIQLQITLTPITSGSSSFVRLKEVIIR